MQKILFFFLLIVVVNSAGAQSLPDWMYTKDFESDDRILIFKDDWKKKGRYMTGADFFNLLDGKYANAGSDDQTLSLVGNTLSIESGNSVDLSSLAATTYWDLNTDTLTNNTGNLVLIQPEQKLHTRVDALSGAFSELTMDTVNVVSQVQSSLGDQSYLNLRRTETFGWVTASAYKIDPYQYSSFQARDGYFDVYVEDDFAAAQMRIKTADSYIDVSELGIGDISPDAKLDVAGSVRIDSFLVNPTDGYGAVGEVITRTANGWEWSPVAGYWDLNTDTLTNNAGATVYTTAGDVYTEATGVTGVYVSSLEQDSMITTLKNSNGLDYAQLYLRQTASTGNVQLSVYDDSPYGYSEIDLADNYFNVEINDGGGASYFNLRTTNGGYISTPGNFGIGDFSPDAKLDVQGSIRLDSFLINPTDGYGAVGEVITRTTNGWEWQAPAYHNNYIDATPSTVTITNTTNYFTVGGFAQLISSGAFTETDSTITYTGAATIPVRIDWHVSFSGDPSDELEGEVFINDVATGISWDRKLGTGGDVGAASTAGIFSLSQNDVIKVKVQNLTAANNISVTKSSVVVVEIK